MMMCVWSVYVKLGGTRSSVESVKEKELRKLTQSLVLVKLMLAYRLAHLLLRSSQIL